MLTLETAGQRVAVDLEEAERLTNEAIRAVAKLQTSMMNTRIDTELAQYEGQVSVVRVQQASGSLVEAMNHLAKAHKGMRSDFIRITCAPDDNERCPALETGEGLRNVA